MKYKILFAFSFLFIIIGCKKEDYLPSYNKGSLTVYTDESFESVTHALADGYMIQYPGTSIKVKVQKEDINFVEMLNGNIKIIVMGRELTKHEIDEYKRLTKLEYQPAPFAADGVVFIVPKDSPKNSISVEEIKQGLNSESKPFIFDGSNASNLNFVAQKIKEKPENLKFSVIRGNENVIKELSKYPGKIGVIGYNAISRPYDPTSQQLREMIKILPVSDGAAPVEISYPAMRTFKYPFTRVVYFLNNESGFNMANRFIRYSCTYIGQKVVDKEGLQPYNLYKREVKMK